MRRGLPEKGFCDRMTTAEPIAACIDPEAMKRFKHAPENLLSGQSAAIAEVAGDAGSTIIGTTDGEPEQGACDGGAGAASRVECVNGLFLHPKE